MSTEFSLLTAIIFLCRKGRFFERKNIEETAQKTKCRCEPFSVLPVRNDKFLLIEHFQNLTDFPLMAYANCQLDNAIDPHAAHKGNQKGNQRNFFVK